MGLLHSWGKLSGRGAILVTVVFFVLLSNTSVWKVVALMDGLSYWLTFSGRR